MASADDDDRCDEPPTEEIGARLPSWSRPERMAGNEPGVRADLPTPTTLNLTMAGRWSEAMAACWEESSREAMDQAPDDVRAVLTDVTDFPSQQKFVVEMRQRPVASFIRTDAWEAPTWR